ncbi:MAG TPA: endonuclease III [Chitinispirillaceae bacterium]|nr:endonuclease III [Chitinispirillaceae bacterium]
MKIHSLQIAEVYELLKEEYHNHPAPVVELIEIQTHDPFKVLLATILSARTKDNVTAKAAQRLFAAVSSMNDIEKIDREHLEKIIYPVGFYRDKAENIKQLPSVIKERFGGNIPSTIEELVELPGVGRKTANLVVAVAFNKPAVCVDIHVHRIFNRLGYLETKTPLETEMELRASLPQKFWTTFNSYFVSFGQNTCLPIEPRCNRCPIFQYCSRINVKTRYQPENHLKSKRSRNSASINDAPDK